MDRAQDEINNMINDLNSVNDEFVNDYFYENEITKLPDIEENDDIKDIEQDELDKTIEIPANFSCSDILNRLDCNDTNNDIDDSATEEKQESLVYDDSSQSKEQLFSYNEILNRLDTKKEVDLNDSNDILNLIENSVDSDEFFEIIEESNND